MAKLEGCVDRRGGLGRLRGVVKGGTGGFHECDGEQGAVGVLMEQKKEVKHR